MSWQQTWKRDTQKVTLHRRSILVLILVLLNVGWRLIVAFTTAEEHQSHQHKSHDARKEYAEDHRNPFVLAHRAFDRVPHLDHGPDGPSEQTQQHRQYEGCS